MFALDDVSTRATVPLTRCLVKISSGTQHAVLVNVNVVLAVIIIRCMDGDKHVGTGLGVRIVDKVETMHMDVDCMRQSRHGGGCDYYRACHVPVGLIACCHISPKTLD